MVREPEFTIKVTLRGIFKKNDALSVAHIMPVIGLGGKIKRDGQ